MKALAPPMTGSPAYMEGPVGSAPAPAQRLPDALDAWDPPVLLHFP